MRCLPPRAVLTPSDCQRRQVLEKVRAHIREDATDIDFTVGPGATDCPPGWESISHRLVRLNVHVELEVRFSPIEHFTYDFQGTRCWTPNVTGVEFKGLELSLACRLWWDVRGRQLKVAVTSAHPSVKWDISARLFGGCTVSSMGAAVFLRQMHGQMLEHHDTQHPLYIDIRKL